MKKEYFIICKTDGTIKIEDFKRDEHGGLLNDIHKTIDGFFEIVHISQIVFMLWKEFVNVIFLCDDEGYLKQLPINITGTALYNHEIRGDIIICKQGYYNHEPDIVGFSNVQEAMKIQKILKNIYNEFSREMK